MTLNQLASLIAKREGKKHQASIGDIREILRVIVELEAQVDSYAMNFTGEAPRVGIWPSAIIMSASFEKLKKRPKRELMPNLHAAIQKQKKAKKKAAKKA